MYIQFHKKTLIPYLLILAVSLAFSSYHGGPASFAWLYALLLLLPFSAAYIAANYAFLRVYQEIEVHKLVRGEDHKYRAKIENAGPLPIHEMRLRTYTDRCNLYEIEDGHPVSLNPREIIELRSGISCIYAGSYDIGIKSVSFSDPFNIFTITIDIPYNFRAVVSPPVTDIADTVLDLENQYNNTGLKSNRLTEDTPGSDLRPYQPGDPLTSINWKVSARLSSLTTRLPDKMEKRTVTILMQAADNTAPQRSPDRPNSTGGVKLPQRSPDRPNSTGGVKLPQRSPDRPNATGGVKLPQRSPDRPSPLRRRDFFLEFIVSAAWHFAKQGVPVRLIYPAGKVTESIVDSYETFMDFYGIVADGIFYHSRQDYEQLQNLASQQRSTANDNGTWILIREDPEPGENNFTICS